MRRFSLVLVCLPLTSIATSLHAQCNSGETAIVADRDNTLYQELDGLLSNGSGDYFFAGNTMVNGLRRGLIHFDVAAALPPDSMIDSATLTLNMSMTRVFDESVRVGLYPLEADWGEGPSDALGQEGGGAPSESGDATWIHAFYDSDFWASPGGDFLPVESAFLEILDTGLYTWKSTPALAADVQGWLDEPASNYGWMVISDENTVPSAVRFDSRESGDPVQPLLCVAAARPAVTEIPTVDTVGLIVLALLLATSAAAKLR